MSSLRPELHVAQQLRRDKLRIQHLQEFPNNLEQLSLHPGFNLDLLQVRNVRNGGNMLDEPPPLYPSEMITSFSSTPSNPLSVVPPRNTFEPQPEPEPTRLMMPPPSHHHHYGSFPHSSSTSNIHSSPKEHLGNWRNSGPHQVSDWMVNYTNTSSVANESNPNSFLASELNNVPPTPTTSNHHYGKPSCNVNVLTDVQSSPLPPLYHNALQDIFKSPNAHGSEMASLIQHGIWGGNSTNEPLLHGDDQFRFGNANLWTNRGVGNTTTTTTPLGFIDKKISNELQNTGHVLSDCNPQGLSLSLSSNSQSKPSHFEEGTATATATDDPQYSKSLNVKSIMKPSIVSRDCGKSLHQDPLGTPSGYRNVGPLGPFTGYATILKSSRFLKPCKQLLDECCRQCGKKFGKSCDVPEWVSREVSVISTSAAESGVAAKGGSNSGGSSSMLYVSKENSGDGGAGSSSDFCLSSRPECQKNKAKLLYMQEEVSRRYKQYHQQMQMVVSSFESVAGLSSATPYVSLALKSVSRHFRCLKNAILDQLKLTCEVLGEDFSVIPATSPSSNKIDNNIARLRCMDQSYQKNKSGGGNIDFLESQQHVWRPQRGLPERSVAILKAWLFEHFLHPYPTDTDKHMLATQTGLSRNQVSNWFINARVRVWKPMVEEIHMLETKGMTEAHKNEGASASEGSSSHQPRVDQPVSKFVGTHSITEKQFQCLEMGSSSAGTNEEKGTNDEQWNQEKRSKLECEITPSMDGTMMGFMPYRRGGLEVGGLGSVSLTLGLRHGVEGVQHQQLQHEEDFRRQFGGHMIHDFVG